MVLTLVLSFVTGFSLVVAAYSWWHASKWAKLIAYGRIVVAYKNKVKLDAPLQEWALWCKQTGKDKAQPEAMRGHVIYLMGHTRIAIFSGKRHPKVKPAKPRPGGVPGQQVREGTWTAKDQTVIQPSSDTR